RDDDIALRIQAAFQNTNAAVYGFDIGRLDGEFGELFFVFNHDLSEMTPGAFLTVDFSMLADWALTIASIFTEVDHDIVNAQLKSALRNTHTPIRTYLREVLSRAVGQHAVLHDVVYAYGGWRIRYFDDILLPPYRPGWRPPHFGVAGVGALSGDLT